ncbi:50S Ribosomal protein L22p/L17e [Candidatus Hodgkinia cicadicola]|uniref:50S Ribosomal protein L22p/L17e n=1 Tax=Candidatus Hodgkinia cicadicola TaxID=573658 RepID=A0ABX4MHP8_9HYPH|nr:50S Ribosomal protein L22p/L17e [Candidatus Hodgkinia cicadicola]
MVNVTYSLKNINYSPKKIMWLKYILRGNICDIINRLEGFKRRKISLLLIKFLKYIYDDAGLRASYYRFILLSSFNVGRGTVRTRLKYGARGRILKIKNIKSNINININIIGKEG